MYYGCIVDAKNLILRVLDQKYEFWNAGPEETRYWRNISLIAKNLQRQLAIGEFDSLLEVLGLFQRSCGVIWGIFLQSFQMLKPLKHQVLIVPCIQRFLNEMYRQTLTSSLRKWHMRAKHELCPGSE